MAFEGEITVVNKCPDCGKKMPVKVCHSGAGYYIGQTCNQCGPYNRLSLHYYTTPESAQNELTNGTYQKRDTDYHPGKITVIDLGKLV